MSKKKIVALVVLILVLLLGALGAYVAKEMPHHSAGTPESVAASGDPVLDAFRRGVAFLRAHQEPDGHFVAGALSPKAAYTALAVDAIVNGPDAASPEKDAYLQKAVDALLATQKASGGIYTDIPMMPFSNYSTALAVTTLKHLNDPRFDAAIARGAAFLKATQNQGEDGSNAGGFGYQGGTRSDVNNSTTVLEALNASGLPADDPAYKAAIQFLTNSQNRSESNKNAWAGDDGGFIYRPGESIAGSTKDRNGAERFASYGTMTYAGLISFLYAHVDKNDPRVKSAFDWIRAHYDLKQIPGMPEAKKDAGLYYYYRLAAKALAAYGERTIETPDGVKHDWAKDLSETLIRLQRPDGSWQNDNSSYLENDAVLVTAYALRALGICRAELAKPPKP